MLQCHLGKREQSEPRTEWAHLDVASFLEPFKQRLAVCLERLEHQMTFKVSGSPIPSDSQFDFTRRVQWGNLVGRLSG